MSLDRAPQFQIPDTPFGKVVMIHEDANLRIWRMQGRDQRLVVSFSGWGPDLSVPQGAGFVGTCSMGGENTVLFVADTARSYFTKPGMVETIAQHIEAERSRIPEAELVTFGDSMGGYGALLMADTVGATRAVGFAPTIDFTPQAMGVRRFSRAKGDFRKVPPPQPLSKLRYEGVELFVVFGINRTDAPHITELDVSPSRHIAIIPTAPHIIPTWLKKKGRLEEFANAAIKGDLPAWQNAIHSLRGAFRPSLRFWVYCLISELRHGYKIRVNRALDIITGARVT